MEHFSKERYQSLIKGLLATGRSVGSLPNVENPSIFLRHDIDYDLSWALEAAKICHAMGVETHFFVQVASPLYNCTVPEARQTLQQISVLGHQIGLHFYNPAPSLDVERLHNEYAILKLLVPQASKWVAWHNPEKFLDQLNLELIDQGFQSAYDANFFGKGKYVSDSNAQRNLEQIVTSVRESDERCIQVLLHPLIWMVGGDEMMSILRQAFKYKTDQLDLMFCENNLWKQVTRRNG